MKQLVFLIVIVCSAACSGDPAAGPTLSAFAFEDNGARFNLDGTGLVEPLEVVIADGNGDPVTTMAATVSTDGTHAEGDAPVIPAPVTKMKMRITLRNGDGRVSAPLVGEFAIPCRTADGSLNHHRDPGMGASDTELLRLLATDYADGVEALAGPQRPSARVVSNAVSAQTGSVLNAAGASDMLWQWGQFVDHDIDLTPAADPVEEANIAVPTGDPQFDPLSTGAVTLAFTRSTYSSSLPRQQLNKITAYIDASNVYGSGKDRAEALRTLDGTGRLRTSAGDLLPFNTGGLDNAGGPMPTLFLAGDVRANEQTGLTCMHTLFVREHNRLADQIRAANPDLDGDAIYQSARRIVGAQMQVITYREFLPLLLGPGALAPYTGYKPEVDPGISNSFSTGAYRLGHSFLSGQILRLDAAGAEIADGHLALRDAFFNPARITDEGGIDPVLRGLAAQRCQELDALLVDDVRNFLFGPPGAGGLDLAALNIQRGRDHGLPSYNDAREGLGLPRKTSFAQITADPAMQARLAAAYTTVDDIDMWVGGLAEDHVGGAMVGELFFTILKEQFERLRDGDRFWYERCFKPDDLVAIEGTRLSDIIRRNTNIGAELPDDVFRAGGSTP